MIHFSKVRFKNFLSTGNAFTEIELDREPTTLIIGENGSGKSTLLDVLCFGLFGKPFRRINIPQLINSVNKKDCVVEVEFRVGKVEYMVRRTLARRSFEIRKNGEMLDQDAAARDSQAYLEKNILKLNFKSFTQIVVLGNSSFVPFMQLTPANRREVIEDLLDIEIFSIMFAILKDKIYYNKEDLQALEYQINLNTEKKTLQEDHIKSIKTNNENKIKKNRKQIEKLDIEVRKRSKKILKHSTAIDQIQDKIKGRGKWQNKDQQFVDLSKSLTKTSKKLSREIAFFNENNHCPTCDQDIPIDTKKLKLENREGKLQKIEDNMDNFQSEWDLVTKQLLVIDECLSEIRYMNNAIASEQTEINALNSYKEKIDKDILDLQKHEDDLKEEKKKLIELKKELRVYEKENKKLTEEKYIMHIASGLLKDGGIKAQIIKQYVPVMNKLINKYLAAMDFFVNFTLSETFNETIKSRFRDEFSYNSFSEGEKMRIDLSLLFCWRAIAKMKNSTNTNLLILDEVFDASLDGAGCEEFLKLIQSLGSSSNVFVISHKGDVLADKFDTTIKFVKHKNFSRIEE
tara:strand:- start:8553 stop:10268 length:1716 start_codon:yes stop_codon:yes gene_type:complete